MTTVPTAPVLLPGQTCAAAGPHDLTGLYVAHHGVRRDLDAFEAAVRNTPVDDATTWRLLRRRWVGFAAVLHHHRALEEAVLWPTMTRRAAELGDERAAATLAAMAAGDGRIDPALAACEAGLVAMVGHPCPAHRDRLDADLGAARAALLERLRREETDALPLLQRILPAEDWQRCQRAAVSTFTWRFLPFVLGWALHALPADAARRLEAAAGTGCVVLHRLGRRRWDRRERRTFRYV